MTVIHVVDLTVLAFDINAALDSGDHNYVTLDAIRSKIENGEIFDFLHDEIHADINRLTQDKKRELLAHWQSLNNVMDSKRKMGVERNGLCLILGYILEGLQNGTDMQNGELPKR